MVPEEVVGDEDGVADRREVVHDGADRALAERAAVELPHRAEAAAERAAARRLDEPDGLEEQAVVPVRGRARRDRAPAAARRRGPSGPSSGARRDPAVAASAAAAPGTSVQRPARRRARRRRPARPPRRRPCRSRRSPATSSGPGNAAAAWPPTRMKASGAARRISRAVSTHAVVLERVHAGDPDQPRARPAHPGRARVAEPQVHDRRRRGRARAGPRRRTRGPSGSTRKKGPSPNRSLPGSGRIRRTFMVHA